MPEKFYKDIEQKARVLCRLEELYDVRDKADMSPWEKHQCSEDEAKIQYFQDRIAQYDYLGRLDLFNGRINYLNIFKYLDNIDMLNIKVKKMKHQVMDLYMNKSTPIDSNDLKKDTFTNQMFTPSGDDGM